MTSVATSAKKAKMAPLTALPPTVTYDSAIAGQTTTFTLKVNGEAVIVKTVQMGPIPAGAPTEGMPHLTTVFALGEEILSTTLHMKMCVHFENKEHLDQAMQKLAGALGCAHMTQELWDQFTEAANAKEVQGLYEYVYKNKASMPVECKVLPFC